MGEKPEVAIVNCIYVEYVLARYPKATFFSKSPSDLVLVYEDDKLRGGLMPIKK